MPTSAIVTTAPSAASPGAGRHGMSRTWRETPHVSAIAPTAPTAPASRPRPPYSSASIAPSIRVLAPSVRRIAAS